MRKIAKLLPTILSVLMVFTSLSVSACDLSCLLNQTSPDCHSASHAAEDGMTVPSAMEMGAGMEMESHAAQSQKPLYGDANGVTPHIIFAQMEMTRRAPQMTSKTEVSTCATFD